MFSIWYSYFTTWPILTAIVGGISLIIYMKNNGKGKSLLKTDFKPGVVYLYQFPRSPVIPSMSPFCLKLETWLRMADINYENVDCSPWTRSKEGLLPFVELDGKQYCDSSLIINELGKRLNKDALESNIPADQKGAAHAFERMLENCTLWSYITIRYGEKMNESFSEKTVVPTKHLFQLQLMIFRWTYKKKIAKRMHGHGIGRHSRDDIVAIGLDDLRALSAFLGGKKFICGDQPCLVDAGLFGCLAQFAYFPVVTPHTELIKSECQNLQKYCDRIKDRYWPDWNEILTTKSLNTNWK